MSVFTPLTPDDIRQFLRQFDLGEYLHSEGIKGGSENTNYFVDCDSGRYVLTLVERGPIQDLPFFIQLLDCLKGAGLPVPFVHRNRDGQGLLSLKNKPALLQPRLAGKHPELVSADQCAALGAMLAKLHSASCGLKRNSDRGPDWVLQHAREFLSTTWQSERDWLEPCLNQLQTELLDNNPDLPQAVIHGDLFRDNAMFEGNQLSGVIDFYNAATGWTLLELAICVNDWCIDHTDQGLQLNTDRVQALRDSYTQQRPLTAAEIRLWPLMLQLAALRFWVSRQQYAEQHRNQPGVLIKDPAYFRDLLKMSGEFI